MPERWGPWTKCPQSGQIQMLAWPPSSGYPGAVVCLGCTYGVQIVKGSEFWSESQAGIEGYAGTVLTHYVRSRPSQVASPDTEMRYARGRSSRSDS